MFVWIPDGNVTNSIRFGRVIKWLVQKFIEPARHDLNLGDYRAAAVYCAASGATTVRFDADITFALELEEPGKLTPGLGEIHLSPKEIKQVEVHTGGAGNSPEFAVMKFGGWWGLVANPIENSWLHDQYSNILTGFPDTPKKAGGTVKAETKYRVLIKWHDAIYKLGQVAITTHSGDIYYFPSGTNTISSYHPPRELDHVSWHPDGRTHIKFRNATEKYDVVDEPGQRLGFRDVGFQEMLKDTVGDFTKLPLYKGTPSDLDIVFEIDRKVGPIVLHFVIVSGKLIVAYAKGDTTLVHPVKKSEKKKLISSQHRALGHHSGYGDILLQYSMQEAQVPGHKTNRSLFLRRDMNIRKSANHPTSGE